MDHRFAVPLATNVVVRPRLHARLGEGLAAPCVLIAAPAGWGKTLLASSWLRTGGVQGAAVWVSLGPSEDDLHAFWATIAEALVPAVGDPAAGSLRNAVTDDLEMAPGQVAAAVNGTPVVLVLDNLHEITRPVVHESFLRLVHRPPPGLRIVATTRRDPPWPLHRLRLAGVLTEIRAVDLAFREDEARALLDGLGIDGRRHRDAGLHRAPAVRGRRCPTPHRRRAGLGGVRVAAAAVRAAGRPRCRGLRPG
jgi:LuxR family transcriptional regulator, maltose regulon positive regulatory protein